MANIRLTVVVRKDLQLVPGLLAAQVSHMADAFMRAKILNALSLTEGGNPNMLTLLDMSFPDFDKGELEWMKEPYLSVLGVNCYEDLVEIMDHCKRESLKIYEWKDIIPSPTFPDRTIRALVGVAIGPDDFDLIKVVTGSMELY